MSRFHDDLCRSGMEDAGDGGDLGDSVQDFPELVALLRGRPSGPAGPGVGAATIMLFYEAGRLKFCISPKDGNTVAFGGPLDVSKLAESLEACLVRGDYDIRPRSGRSRR